MIVAHSQHTFEVWTRGPRGHIQIDRAAATSLFAFLAAWLEMDPRVAHHERQERLQVALDEGHEVDDLELALSIGAGVR